MSLDSFFGGGDTSLNPGNVPIVTFRGGGLKGTFDKDGDEQGAATITSSPQRRRQVRRLQRGFLREARQLGRLKKKFSKAGGRLRRTIKTQSLAQQRKSVGNLRENLARRRVLGSSFAGDAVGRTEAEFAKQRGESLAVAKLKELDVQTQLIQAINVARRNATNVKLNELNLQAQLAANFQAGLQAAFSQAQATQQQLAVGILESLGSGIGAVGGFALGGGFNPLFGGGSEVPATVVGPIT